MAKHLDDQESENKRKENSVARTTRSIEATIVKNSGCLCDFAEQRFKKNG